MSNLSCSNSRILLPLLVAALALCSSHHAVAEDITDVEWWILTASNYTSQIRLHPRLLLIVTVPWSGESRSLMKEIALVVARDQATFGKLKLMIIYKNMESMLADALGATHGTTIIYCHDAFSYKYGGKLRVQNILFSVQYIMSFSSDQLPLKSLATPSELRDFLDSTDKAVILFEFCGWTPRMLAMIKKMTENGFDFSRESNATLVGQKEKSKCMKDAKLSCDNDNGFSGMPWFGQFTSINDSLIGRTENLTNGAGDTCTLDEFQKFDILIQKFVKVNREFLLPPEKTNFALVREKSLLSLFNIEEPADWMIVVSFAACSSCSKVIREVDDLRTVLQAHVSPVSELEDDFLADETSLPAKRPTMLLFIDRSSNSMQIRRESQDALNAFREAAQHHEMLNQIHRQASRPGRMSIETTKASWSTLKHSKLQPSPAPKRLMFKDKMSMMIVNEGQQITLENLVSDLQGSSLHEILSYALKQKKEIKLSTLAKDAGFQLLSKDVEIEESLPSQSEIRCNQVLQEPSAQESLRSAIELDETQKPVVNLNGQNEELCFRTDENNVVLQSNEDSLDKSSQFDVEPQRAHHSMVGTEDILGWDEDTRLKDIDENEYKVFDGSFFFVDGQYRLLETLTGGSKMPSVVIIDPLSQQHYVSDEQSAFSLSALLVFIDSFLLVKLSPHLQSAPTVPTVRSGPRPPFVNLNFHETDSIPQVTTRSFAELVLGNISASQSSDGSRGRNVMVLFSNSWCGFCQRMELVVREVYRAIESCIKLKMSSSRKEKWTSMCEYIEDVTLKLPLIYMMDCTQNDCSLIIKHTEQRELYPLLMLFPSEMKNKTVVYEGDIVVSDVIKFLADHGSHVNDLIIGEGSGLQQVQRQGDPQSKNLHHEVVLKERLQSVDVKYYDNRNPSEFPVGSHDKAHLFAGCLLTATEKLLEVHPFDESKILIVRVDQGTGFQGLIINKHIKWESLEDGFKVLKHAPLSFGGPVMRRGMPLVALTHKFVEGGQVLPNVYFIDPIATHSLLGEIRAGNRPVDGYWFFLGYASWGFNQLFTEIAQGAWNISQGNLEQLGWPLR